MRDGSDGPHYRLEHDISLKHRHRRNVTFLICLLLLCLFLLLWLLSIEWQIQYTYGRTLSLLERLVALKKECKRCPREEAAGAPLVIARIAASA